MDESSRDVINDPQLRAEVLQYESERGDILAAACADALRMTSAEVRRNIAAMAMQGMLADAREPFCDEKGIAAETIADSYAICAKLACGYADALLAELAKEPA